MATHLSGRGLFGRACGIRGSGMTVESLSLGVTCRSCIRIDEHWKRVAASADDVPALTYAALLAQRDALLAALREFTVEVYGDPTREMCGQSMRDRLARADAAIALCDGARS